MLSVLIPTYNYSVVQLVKTLYRQLQDAAIVFEIICFDNGSKSKTNLLNKEINDLPFCYFNALDSDFGRSKVRNLLAQQSKYEWILFLDSDVLPVSARFIKNYIESIHINNKVIYGGLKYYDSKPSKEFMLRWVYGKKREEVSLKTRNLNPNIHFSSANFLINKEVFKSIKFNEKLIKYGHEDTLLAIELRDHNISIQQIDNPVYHLGLDKNQEFIKKTKKAVENLDLLLHLKKINGENSKLIGYYLKIKKLKAIKRIAHLYSKYAKRMEKNLISNKPSLVIYDLYKLSYLCSISKN